MKTTIGQVARLAGVGVETVRFYEREGLLAQPARPISGYRDYPDEAVARLHFIQRAKALGFSLKEIRELLHLSGEPTSSCAEVKQQAEAKMDEIEGKIADLLQIKRTLAEVAKKCNGDGSHACCPILEVLENDPSKVEGNLTFSVSKTEEKRKEKHVESPRAYPCPICHLHFRDKRVQQQCEAWCRTHTSCCLSIARQSQEAQENRVCGPQAIMKGREADVSTTSCRNL